MVNCRARGSPFVNTPCAVIPTLMRVAQLLGRLLSNYKAPATVFLTSCGGSIYVMIGRLGLLINSGNRRLT